MMDQINIWNDPGCSLMMPEISIIWLEMGLEDTVCGRLLDYWEKMEGMELYTEFSQSWLQREAQYNSRNKLMWAHYFTSISVWQDKNPWGFHGEKKKKKALFQRLSWDFVLWVSLTVLALCDFNKMVTRLERWVNGLKNSLPHSYNCAEIPRTQGCYGVQMEFQHSYNEMEGGDRKSPTNVWGQLLRNMQPCSKMVELASKQRCKVRNGF